MIYYLELAIKEAVMVHTFTASILETETEDVCVFKATLVYLYSKC